MRNEPSVEMRLYTRWLITLLCIVAAVLSLWMSIQKWSGRIDSLAGCGTGSGCANVLGSKWSMVWGVIPVSIFSLLLYVAVFFSLRLNRQGVRSMRAFAAWMCLWAALWFTGLQFFVLKSFCLYCMSMHGLGVLLGLSILFGEGDGVFKKRGLPMFFAAGAIAGLALVQHVGPAPVTHRVDVLNTEGIITPDSGAQGGVKDSHAQGVGRQIQFLEGAKSYNIEELPHLGAADAEHVMVEYFDYTCEACRQMHRYLERAVANHPQKLAVIVLPIPLDRGCNENLPKGLSSHENACELARLGLMVWRADPTMFAEYHRNLFENQGMPIEVADALAVSLVGEENMSKEHDAWVDAVLAQNIADYQWLIRKTPVMPKLLLKDSVMVQGLIADQSELDSLLLEHLGLQ